MRITMTLNMEGCDELLCQAPRLASKVFTAHRCVSAFVWLGLNHERKLAADRVDRFKYQFYGLAYPYGQVDWMNESFLSG